MANNRHNVFVSYHHGNDQKYRDEFERLFSDKHDIFVSKSVQIGEIPDNTPTEIIRQIIRDEYLRDTTVTIVLIGSETWKRKHVDWEIGSSIRQTSLNPRSGLIGIILPSYPRNSINNYNQFTIPPRLYDNIKCDFSKIYNWSDNPIVVQSWIHEAFERRNKINPDNSFPNFVNNRTNDKWSY